MFQIESISIIVAGQETGLQHFMDKIITFEAESPVMSDNAPIISLSSMIKGA